MIPIALCETHIWNTQSHKLHFQFCDTCFLISQEIGKIGGFIENMYIKTPRAYNRNFTVAADLSSTEAFYEIFGSYALKGSDWLPGHLRLGYVNATYRNLALLPIKNYWPLFLYKIYNFLYLLLIFLSVYFLNIIYKPISN